MHFATIAAFLFFVGAAYFRRMIASAPKAIERDAGPPFDSATNNRWTAIAIAAAILASFAVAGVAIFPPASLRKAVSDERSEVFKGAEAPLKTTEPAPTAAAPDSRQDAVRKASSDHASSTSLTPTPLRRESSTTEGPKQSPNTSPVADDVAGAAAAVAAVSSASSGGSTGTAAKTVHVNGYTTKNGTTVAPYTRNSPGRR